MKLTLLRFPSFKDSTLGGLLVNERFQCFTLEDEFREVKVPGETRIPAGTYRVALQTAGKMHEKYTTKYPEHRGMLTLVSVPDFTSVMIHVGNTDRDSAGCILVGDMAMANGELGQSVVAYRKLYGMVSNAILAGEGATIEIRDYA
jgi:hypothetical protein